MSAPLLQVRGVSKHFAGVRAVDGVDFSIDVGEIVALIGPNGAGKSTLFGVVAGQYRATAGTVLFNGQALAGRDPAALARAGIGRTFQTAQTWGTLTVLQNVQLALSAAAGRVFDPFTRLDDIEDAPAHALLSRVGLAERAALAAAALPYPDSKRLELAIALASAPRLLLMDEPTAGMAPRERVALMALAAEIARTRRLAVLFTEHDMDVVFGHADRILVLDRGALIASGRPADVRADARVRAVYLGAGDASGGH